ncbi:MAG TPA: 2-C-methyl-D-erythritol 2,4-cyclodiphosphate synthase [Candidatus Saccharimonadaceae bacterium]|jgi:2-C-methyl-D-erythritol 2,4-cyclodiphosphate synthase|nr:2-C-methyl-D-erythritol 2,4-cyclodiphosphate synthase [Candidatus Saccharimonadaceae bacterium]
MALRVGMGYDIHRKADGRHLVLGGLWFQGERGLDGHSDADVLLHAIADALLGAAALGDIGKHFPPGDARWKDSSSLELLGLVRAMLDGRGARILNVDSTVVAERPRIEHARDAMCANIARALRVGIEQVSVKATTNEGLGAVGRDEGIAAWAVAAIELPDPASR